MPFASAGITLPEYPLKLIECPAQGKELSGAYFHGEVVYLPECKKTPQSCALFKCGLPSPMPPTITVPQKLIPRFFDGFEAVVEARGDLFLAMEIRAPNFTSAYLAKAIPNADGNQFTVTQTTRIPLNTRLDNLSVETLIQKDERLFAIEEVNFPPHNAAPVAHVYDLSLNALGTIPFPQIPYRITDATPPDEQGRFWAINYFWPGDSALAVENDPIALRWGIGFTHAHHKQVERLLQFELRRDQITLVDRPPVYLELEEAPRNWEAVAFLGAAAGRCRFMLATDTYPRPIVAEVLIPSA